MFSTLGNRELKPERSTELELGFDVTAFDSRISAEVTRYKKSSKDALISRILPPSLGTGATSRLENLGEVQQPGLGGADHRAADARQQPRLGPHAQRLRQRATSS